MTFLRLNLVVILALVLTSCSLAQTSSSSIFRFLEISPSARTSALGGNHVAMFEPTVSEFYLNPAYLNPASSRTVSATFVNYLADSKTGFGRPARNAQIPQATPTALQVWLKQIDRVAKLGVPA